MGVIPLVAIVVPGAALAGGVYVGEAGSQAMERAGAFVAKADDPTALSVNPAGLAKSRRVELYLGANLLNMNLSFQRAGTYPNQNKAVQPDYVGSPFPETSNEAGFQAVPYLAASQRWKNLAFGEGIFAPAGVPNRDFPCMVEDQCQIASNGAPLPTRYDVVSQHALIAYPSLGVAYRVHPRFDVGVRASWGFARVEARNFPWALPNSSENPRAEADFDASVSDSFVPAFGAGVLYRPIDSVELGAAYASSPKVRARGTGNARLGPEVDPLGGNPVFIEPMPLDYSPLCEPAGGGQIAALNTCLNFNLPQTVTVGGRYILHDGKGGERADIELDVRWENWANASDDEIIVDGRDTLLLNPLKPVISRHGFRDVLSLRLGGAYKIDVGEHSVSLRGGVSYDTAAAPESWTRVDKDGRARALFSGGAAYDLGRWRIDAGFAYVAEGTLNVRDMPNPNPTFENRTQPDPLQPSTEQERAVHHPINAGRYTSSYIVGSMGVTAAF
jgi:long-subunit fatty acid transport protein